MTYFGFLLRFLVIPILIFLAIIIWNNRNFKQINGFRNGRVIWLAIGIHVLMAVIYTTPWDNYLVATRVWYYNPNLVTGLVIGYVPIEEYTFFIFETVLSGLLWWFLASRISHRQKEVTPNRSLVYLPTCMLVFLWLIATFLFFFGAAQWTYLSIILFWALPALIVQVLFGADILWHYRKLVVWSILIPGTYLSLIDMIALKETTWAISPSQATGILFFGILPLEEIVFFFITNTLITFGITLLLANLSQERFAEIKKRIPSWKDRQTFQAKN